MAVPPPPPPPPQPPRGEGRAPRAARDRYPRWLWWLLAGAVIAIFVASLAAPSERRDKIDYGALLSQTNDGKVDANDILSIVTKVVDHGQGLAVDVFFSNGAELTFNGCGTAGSSIHALTDLVDTSHIQVS